MRQLIKFCIVGATSTLIDKSILWLLLSVAPGLPWYLSQSIAFVFGVTNGFIWNRLWTFKAMNHGAMSRQYPKFFASNLIGLALNLFITKGFLILFTGQIKHAANPDKTTIILASLCAVPLVVIWNFSASRLWTFRAAPTDKPSTPSNPSAPIISPLK